MAKNTHESVNAAFANANRGIERAAAHGEHLGRPWTARQIAAAKVLALASFYDGGFAVCAEELAENSQLLNIIRRTIVQAYMRTNAVQQDDLPLLEMDWFDDVLSQEERRAEKRQRNLQENLQGNGNDKPRQAAGRQSSDRGKRPPHRKSRHHRPQRDTQQKEMAAAV